MWSNEIENSTIGSILLDAELKTHDNLHKGEFGFRSEEGAW